MVIDGNGTPIEERMIVAFNLHGHPCWGVVVAVNDDGPGFVTVHIQNDHRRQTTFDSKSIFAPGTNPEVNCRASYQHRMDELRGRVKGLFRNELRRWLETALVASRAGRGEVTEERLEDVLRTMSRFVEKEIDPYLPLHHRG
jgi:hypothetical protein